MKTLLLIPMLFLISTFGYLHAQCPVTVTTSSDTSCLFITWQDGQPEIPDTLSVDGNIYAFSSADNNFAIYTDTLSEETCSAGDSVGSIDFTGVLDYLIGADSFACEFSEEGYLPPCPDTVYMLDVQSCLLLSINPNNAAQLPDTIMYEELPYTYTSENDLYLVYSQTDTECDLDNNTPTPLDGDLTIGASGCHYDAGLLPITILAFEATDEDGTIELSWRVNSEEPTRTLHVQRSYDGVDWESVYEQSLTNFTAGQTMDGEFTDQTIDQSRIYYRLFISGVSGETKYSNILPITLKDEIINNVFFQSQSRSIMVKAGKNFTGEMYLFNTQGQNVLTKKVQMHKNTYQEIDVQGHLTPGVYFVKFDDGHIPPSKIFID